MIAASGVSSPLKLATSPHPGYSPGSKTCCPSLRDAHGSNLAGPVVDILEQVVRRILNSSTALIFLKRALPIPSGRSQRSGRLRPAAATNQPVACSAKASRPNRLAGARRSADCDTSDRRGPTFGPGPSRLRAAPRPFNCGTGRTTLSIMETGELRRQPRYQPLGPIDGIGRCEPPNQRYLRYYRRRSGRVAFRVFRAISQRSGKARSRSHRYLRTVEGVPEGEPFALSGSFGNDLDFLCGVRTRFHVRDF